MDEPSDDQVSPIQSMAAPRCRFNFQRYSFQEPECDFMAKEEKQTKKNVRKFLLLLPPLFELPQLYDCFIIFVCKNKI